MRLISFFLTQPQIKRREKSVTRRGGWQDTKPGELLLGVVKGQGIPKGEKVEPLCIIEVISVRREPLDAMITDLEYGRQEVVAEGFPHLSPVAFTVMYREHNGGQEDQEVTRLAFRYRDDLWEEYQKKGPGSEKAKTWSFKSGAEVRFESPGTGSYAGITARKSITHPQTKKEARMAKGSKKEEGDKAEKGRKEGAPSPEKAAAEKDAIDQALSASAPASEKPAEAPVESKSGGEVTKMPLEKTFIEDYDATVENLPSFQKVVFVEFSEHEYSEKGKKLAGLFADQAAVESEKAEVVKGFTDKIKAIESEKQTLAAQITSRGEEKEIECRKRIDESRSMVIIFDSNTMEIVEERKLNSNELQTELRFQQANKQGAVPRRGERVVKGNWPDDQKIGASAKDDPEEDAKNDEVIRNMAEDAKA